MIGGFYRMTFTGSSGSGFGVILFHQGIIVGADVAGVIFDGSYTPNTNVDGVEFALIMRAPAGVTLVQTGIPLAAPTDLQITGSLSEEVVGTSVPTRLKTSIGPVNVLFQKIRDV